MTRLEFERRRRKWSQTDLGDVCGLHQYPVSLIEHGRLLPTADQLERLSTALGVPGEVLLREVRVTPEPEEMETAR